MRPDVSRRIGFTLYGLGATAVLWLVYSYGVVNGREDLVRQICEDQRRAPGMCTLADQIKRGR